MRLQSLHEVPSLADREERMSNNFEEIAQTFWFIMCC